MILNVVIISLAFLLQEFQDSRDPLRPTCHCTAAHFSIDLKMTFSAVCTYCALCSVQYCTQPKAKAKENIRVSCIIFEYPVLYSSILYLNLYSKNTFSHRISSLANKLSITLYGIF